MTTVTMSPIATPSYRVGPSAGSKIQSLLEVPDCHITDDCLIEGDLECKGTFYGTLFTAGADIVTNHITASLEVDDGSDLVAAAGESHIDYALSTGIFTSPSGANTLSGDVTIATGKTFTQVGTGGLSTGTGAIALNGNTTIAGAKTFTSGTGTVSLLGNVEIAAGKNLTLQTDGAFSTGTGDVNLRGNVIVGDGKNITQGTTGALTTGSGAVALNGHTTIAAGKNLTMTTTGAFSSGTGAVALKGDTTISTTKTLAVTDSDKLTVGGIIVPQKVVINVPLNAASASQWIFTADASYEVVSAEVIYTVTSTSGKVNLYKSTSVQAPAAGTACLTGVIALDSTANTVYNGTLSGTASDYQLADGNKLALVISGTMTGLVGGNATIILKRI